MPADPGLALTEAPGRYFLAESQKPGIQHERVADDSEGDTQGASAPRTGGRLNRIDSVGDSSAHAEHNCRPDPGPVSLIDMHVVSAILPSVAQRPRGRQATGRFRSASRTPRVTRYRGRNSADPRDAPRHAGTRTRSSAPPGARSDRRKWPCASPSPHAALPLPQTPS